MSKKLKASDNPADILIVEDSPTQAARIKYLLESHNYTTEVTENGSQALTWLASHKPSIVISDILMPGINGFELCEKIKSDKSTADIPIILLTSLSDTEEVVKGLIAGADSFLSKPYDSKHLLSNIKRILEESGTPGSDKENATLEINYRGRKRVLQTSPKKVIKVLLNIYQGAIFQNEKLVQAQEDLRLLNERLESLVEDRTSALVAEIKMSRQMANRLLESEAKYRTIVETANEGIWQVDSNVATTYVNGKMAEILGYDSLEMIGRQAFDFMDEEGKTLAKMRFENSKKGIKESYEHKYIRKDGTYIITLVKVTPLKDRDGTFAGSIGLVTDITKRKKVENEILELNRKLLISNKELENFAHVASHDLQEPLRMVSSFTQLLELQYSDRLDDRAREYIRFAVDGAKRMYDLLNGLLAYSRIQRKGKVFTPVDLNHVLDNVLKTLAITIKERTAIIKADKLPLINADESQMNQLFQNLISNGIKFSNGSPRIYVSSRTEKDKYVFSVKDEGIGIEPQYFERIFQIFQRLFPKDQYEGTGIGLSICKSIVERHQGKIWVESEPGKGSTFYFTCKRTN